MYDNGSRTTERADRINWPAIADPMILLDELERRLDNCETVVARHLEDIQRRLDRLETDVADIRSDMQNNRLAHEKTVVTLADRLTRIEDRIR